MNNIDGQKLIDSIIHRFETHIILNEQMSNFLRHKGLADEFVQYLDMTLDNKGSLQ